MHFEVCKMKDAVGHLRAGWHGNANLFDDLGRELTDMDCGDGDVNHPYKQAADCGKLWGQMIKKANEVFIPMCPGLSGTIRSLIDDGSYEPRQ
jgi:hypothetical protein